MSEPYCIHEKTGQYNFDCHWCFGRMKERIATLEGALREAVCDCNKRIGEGGAHPKSCMSRIAKEALAARPEADRCIHGVWKADHCWKCNEESPSVSGE